MKTHILVVDDEPDIAESLADYLRKTAGYQVTIARNGQDAMTILEKSPAGTIDLVLLDMRMPVMSGLEVLAWLRGHPTLQYTRVVMLTAAAGSQDKVEALSAGADDYITKPYYPQELLARVKTILRTQQLEKQLKRQSQQLTALNQISSHITTTLDVKGIPAVTTHGLRAILSVQIVAFFTVDKQGYLRCQSVASLDESLVGDDYADIASGASVTGRVFSENTPILLNHPLTDNRFWPAIDAPPHIEIHNILAFPLQLRGRPVGVITAVNKTIGFFTQTDYDLMASLSGAVSRAMENARLFQGLQLQQQQLQESHNRLQAVMDGILDPIYTINDLWSLVAVNQTKADSVGLPPEELVGKLCYQLFFDRPTPCVACRVTKTLATHQPQHWAMSWLGADHLTQEWDVHAYPIPNNQSEEPQAVVVWHDRTEERRLEKSLIQAGKLAAIGQLAAGVAHEINNPLTAINANAQILQMVISPDDENYESVELIALAGDRATKVVRGLLDYARQNPYTFELGNVNESITQALSLVAYQIRSTNIVVEQQLVADLPEIVASWEDLKTVWLNLLINARDALAHLPDERRIDIVTRVIPAGTHLQVLIRDNGVGITAAEQAHIFEPFYTTKSTGEGTGLGLATCHRIVSLHGGDIQVVSEPGQGATFIVGLPLPEQQGIGN